MKVVLERAGQEIHAQVSPAGDGFVVALDGRSRRIEGSFGRAMRVRVDARPVEATVRREGLDVVVEISGRTYPFRVRDARAPKLARRSNAEDLARGEIHAPMPGRVVELLVEVGDVVEAGSPAVVVEAMKMQNALVAAVTGRVQAIPVAVGATVETGQLLVSIAPEAK